jgi:YVTN family beta-propeller protein
MQSSNLSGNRSSTANCLGVQWAILAMGLGAMAWPGEVRAWTGQPLAYVTSSAGVSVIDTGDNQVVNTIHASSSSVAVAPDGKHIYVFGPSTSDFVFNISVIDAANDSVVATIPLDVSLIPDGRSSERKLRRDSRYAGWQTCLCNDRNMSDFRLSGLRYTGRFLFCPLGDRHTRQPSGGREPSFCWGR